MNLELEAYLAELSARDAEYNRVFYEKMGQISERWSRINVGFITTTVTTSDATELLTASSDTSVLVTASAGLKPPAPPPSIVASPLVALAAPIDNIAVMPASCSTKCAAQAVMASTTTTLLPWVSASSSSPVTSVNNGVVSTELASDNNPDEHGVSAAPSSLSSSPTQFTTWKSASPTAPTPTEVSETQLLWPFPVQVLSPLAPVKHSTECMDDDTHALMLPSLRGAAKNCSILILDNEQVEISTSSLSHLETIEAEVLSVVDVIFDDTGANQRPPWPPPDYHKKEDAGGWIHSIAIVGNVLLHPRTTSFVSRQFLFQYCYASREYLQGCENFQGTNAWSVSYHFSLSNLHTPSTCVNLLASVMMGQLISEVVLPRIIFRKRCAVLVEPISPGSAYDHGYKWLMLWSKSKNKDLVSCFIVHINQCGFALFQWKIAWSHQSECSEIVALSVLVTRFRPDNHDEYILILMKIQHRIFVNLYGVSKSLQLSAALFGLYVTFLPVEIDPTTSTEAWEQGVCQHLISAGTSFMFDLLVLLSCSMVQQVCILQSGCNPNWLLSTAPFLYVQQLLGCPSLIGADLIQGVPYVYGLSTVACALYDIDQFLVAFSTSSKIIWVYTILHSSFSWLGEAWLSFYEHDADTCMREPIQAANQENHEPIQADT